MRAVSADGNTISGEPARTWAWNRIRKTIALTAALMSAAASIAAAQSSECAPGSLADYEKLNSQGCVIGDKHFANFSYYRASDGLPAEAISVTPGTVPGDDEPALLFEGKWSAPSSLGSYITYTVDVSPDKPAISGASLEMQFGEVSGTGKANVFAELCPAASGPEKCGPGELKLKVALSPGQPRRPTDSGALTTPQRQLRVITPVTVEGGKNGTASLNGFMVVFHSGSKQPDVARIYRRTEQ